MTYRPCLTASSSRIQALQVPAPEEAVSRSTPGIAGAALLAAAGGIIDAGTWLLHGRVFASVMTGNLVEFGAALLGRDLFKALHLAVAIACYCAGVYLARMLRASRIPGPQRAAVLLELTGLAIAGALPRSFPDIPFTALVALAGALQVAAFRKVDDVAYSSTYMTGNLRSLTDALYDFLHTPNDGNRQSARISLRDMTAILTGFLAGVLTEAALAPRLGNRSFWVAGLLLVPVFLRLHRRR